MRQGQNRVKFKFPDFRLPLTSKSDPSVVYNNENRFIKAVYERRIGICFDLIKKRYRRTLDLGTGSGVCIPSLLEVSDYVVGLDLHEALDEVKKTLRSRGYRKFNLVKADAYKMPFGNGSFDLIVGISIFEHLASNEKIVNECRRVLADDGDLIMGIPVENFITKLRYFYYGPKYKISCDHLINSAEILNGFRRHFYIEESRKLMRFVPLSLCLYYAARLKKIKIKNRR